MKIFKTEIKQIKNKKSPRLMSELTYSRDVGTELCCKLRTTCNLAQKGYVVY